MLCLGHIGVAGKIVIAVDMVTHPIIYKFRQPADFF